MIAVLLLGVLEFFNSRSSVFEEAAREQADQNERNQRAILRLLDEMGSLADGDLTVEATVTEDITGTIADSFNYAIEELRKLVATVNETAIKSMLRRARSYQWLPRSRRYRVMRSGRQTLPGIRSRWHTRAVKRSGGRSTE
jgi:hypothetical protein